MIATQSDLDQYNLSTQDIPLLCPELPIEIWLNIIHNIKNPIWLRNICLVSKMHANIIRYIYEKYKQNALDPKYRSFTHKLTRFPICSISLWYSYYTYPLNSERFTLGPYYTISANARCYTIDELGSIDESNGWPDYFILNHTNENGYYIMEVCYNKRLYTHEDGFSMRNFRSDNRDTPFQSTVISRQTVLAILNFAINFRTIVPDDLFNLLNVVKLY